MKKPVLLAVAGVLLVVTIVAFAWWNQVFESRKNVFGRASLEHKLSECSPDSGKTVIRLYRGEPGATDSFWYSVTASSQDSKEAQFFYTYQEPEITELKCLDGTISLALSTGAPKVISVGEIAAMLINPVGIKKGKY